MILVLHLSSYIVMGITIHYKFFIMKKEELEIYIEKNCTLSGMITYIYEQKKNFLIKILNKCDKVIRLSDLDHTVYYDFKDDDYNLVTGFVDHVYLNSCGNIKIFGSSNYHISLDNTLSFDQMDKIIDEIFLYLEQHEG